MKRLRGGTVAAVSALALVAGLLGGCGDARPPFVAEACTRGDLGGSP